MITQIKGFITYGVHKDGLKDPMGAPFIDEDCVAGEEGVARCGRGVDRARHHSGFQGGGARGLW